jgi:cytidylate kinase
MIITIAGQYGSGGDQVGVRLAEMLNYKLYDAELIIRAREIYDAEYSEILRPIARIERGDVSYYHDAPSSSVSYRHAEIAIQTDLMFSDMIHLEKLGPESEDLRKAMLDAQTRAVLEYAEGGNCILFSKCSSYILRDRTDTIHAFSTADLDVRIMRVMNLHNIFAEEGREGKKRRLSLTNVILARKMINMDRDSAKDLINSTDARRAAYHEFVTGEKWEHPKHYDFFIYGNKLDYMEEQTELFLQYIREKEQSLAR